MQFNHKKLIFGKRTDIICYVVAVLMMLYGFYLLVNPLILEFRGIHTSIFLSICKGVAFIYIGVFISTKAETVKIYKSYFAVLSTDPTHSISHLPIEGSIIDKNRNFIIIKRLTKLINKGYFPAGTYIDRENNRLVFPNEASGKIASGTDGGGEYISVVCKNCGAANKIVNNSAGECEYCGLSILA